MTDHEFKAPERTITAPDETTARLGEIRERVAAATEGPWEHGDRQYVYGVTGRFGDDRCPHCARTGFGDGPSWAGVRNINGKEMLVHVHTSDKPRRRHGVHAVRANGSISVVRDAEEYGYMYPADAEFIAHARQDIPWLLSEIERLTTESGETVHPRSSAPCTECVEDAARLGAKVERLLGECDRARGLAARLEAQLAQVAEVVHGMETQRYVGMTTSADVSDVEAAARTQRAVRAHAADLWAALEGAPKDGDVEYQVDPVLEYQVDPVLEYLDRLKGMDPSPTLAGQIAELEAAHHAKNGGE